MSLKISFDNFKMLEGYLGSTRDAAIATGKYGFQSLGKGIKSFATSAVGQTATAGAIIYGIFKTLEWSAKEYSLTYDVSREIFCNMKPKNKDARSCVPIQTLASFIFNLFLI